MASNMSKWGRDKARERYDMGGSVPKGDVQPLEPSPGPIEKIGVSTYRRELGRDAKSGKFGVNPYIYPRGK